MLFTTSWDDGYALDVRLADLLARYGMTGTFYPCPRPQRNQRMLTSEDMRLLSHGFEIGAHTITHPRLTSIPLTDAEREIRESKGWVEERTGQPCTMFCYPKGDWNSSVRDLVEAAGYRGARTTEMLRFSIADPFTLPTSLHVYPFPLRRRWTRLRHVFDPLPWHRTYGQTIKEMRLPLTAHTSWLRFAQAVFLHAIRTEQKFFHLWGHSEEVDRFGMWKDLEQFLQFVTTAGVPLSHVHNGDLLTVSPSPR